MLFIVGTPIGNLDDLSIRQARTLLSVEIILTEDTRTTGILLRRILQLFAPLLSELTQHDLPRLISYHKDNEFERLEMATQLLEEGKEVALISQAGMPLISDPGYMLTAECIRKQLPFTVIPGPSAVTTALIHAGFKSEHWMFFGFFAKKPSALKKQLKQIEKLKETLPELVLVAFESPYRVHKTLEIIKEHHPQWKVVITRELTKTFEEIIRSTLLPEQIKGEITLVIQ